MRSLSSNTNALIPEQTTQLYSFSYTKLLPFILLPIFPVFLVHLYFKPFYLSHITTHYYLAQNLHVDISPPPLQEDLIINNKNETSCDYTQGDWVKTNLGPLYNGTTCDTIKQGQNCIAYGRPDTDYLYWRWNPNQCELPRFDPKTFLGLLKNRQVAFVGDSLARNQLESLLCSLATASRPNLYYTSGEDNKFRKWHLPSHNINVSIYWSPFLVKGVEKKPEKDFNSLFLDTIDERWARDLEHIDMLVLSIGHWYLHRAVYHYGDKILGCHYLDRCTEVGFYDAYSRALETAFDEIIRRIKQENHARVKYVFLTTFSPAHFEGEWDKYGACSKTQPYKANDTALEGMNEEMGKIEVKALVEAKSRAIDEEVITSKLRFEAVDITRLALLRPDAHPGPYMNPFPFANGIAERVQNDCVHWCLPGAIDTWNEILLDIIKRWEE